MMLIKIAGIETWLLVAWQAETRRGICIYSTRLPKLIEPHTYTHTRAIVSARAYTQTSAVWQIWPEPFYILQNLNAKHIEIVFVTIFKANVSSNQTNKQTKKKQWWTTTTSTPPYNKDTKEAEIRVDKMHTCRFISSNNSKSHSKQTHFQWFGEKKTNTQRNNQMSALCNR